MGRSFSLSAFIITTLLATVSTLVIAEEESGKPSLFDWTTTEIHYQYGNNFKRPFSAENDQQASVTTLQHADGWKYGDNFFFVDVTDAEDTGSDIYSELYSNFSLGKIFDKEISFGPVNDIGIIAGINYAKDAKVVKYLPGVRLSWSIPQFAFLNTDITAYIDDSQGINSGGAPTETNSYMVDVNWALPFSIGRHDFSLEGHVEYIDSRSNEFGGNVKSHVLGQPQLRYDLGKALFNKPGFLFTGLEYQFWINKLGGDKDEHVVQALVVIRL
jgi:nucleoside-specific outer membrane channel protein Tsx